ncbi:hypothetical protein SCA6_013266 [Theobroma cacao]
MSLAGSSQLSHDLGLCRNQGYNKKFKVLQQDSWRIRLSDSLCRPIHSVPYRNNAFRCHSFRAPGQIFELPGVKAVSVAVTRSYNILQGSPLVFKLVPAFSIIIFALWGVAPLIRQSRSLLFHKSDNSWKKSRTHYITTSYIQPLLLWTGAILICSMIQQLQKFFMETNETTDDTRNMGFQFAGKAIYSAVWIAAVSLFMELLGFSTQKWLTAGGLGTVLLTLAGREYMYFPVLDILLYVVVDIHKFLSCAMIHATRPFVVNEWVETKIEGYGVSGTVEHVGWWSPTIVRGEDREAVHIPNHKFTVNVVRNLSQKTHWRIKTHLAISHLDINKINNIVADMRKVLAKNPQVEQQRLHRRVFLENVNPENQALLILVSCFVRTSHLEEYLCVKEAILLDLLRVISHHRARLATSIRTLQKIYSDADLENIPFADSVYSRGGVPSNRPLLLIEPSYKINGATPKPVSKAKGAPSIEPKADAKIGETPNSDTKEDLNAAFASTSDLKTDDKVGMKSPSKSVPKTSSNAIETYSPDQKVLDSISDNLPQDKKVTDKQQKIARQSSKLDNPSVSSSDAGIDKAGGLREPLQSKQEGEKLPVTQPPIARPVLEENIVLGVALEGTKRTLPIEEGMTPSPADAKEMASASRNGSGSTAEDKKDGQVRSSPSTPDEL